MKKGYLYAAIAILCWSTVAPATKMLVTELPNMQVLFICSAIATVTLLLFNLQQKNLHILKGYTARDFAIQAGLGALGIFAYTAFYNFGLQRLSAQDANIINYLWPIMIILFSIPILKEKFTLKKMAAVFLSFFGLVVIVTRGSFGNIEMGSFAGIAACVAAAVCFGLFSALNKKTGYNQFIGMMIFFAVSALFSGIALLPGGELRPLSAGQIGGLVWVGVATYAVAYLAWALALKGGDTAKISNLAYMVPFLNIIFSVILLGENVYVYSVVGLMFIVVGILLQSMALLKRR